MATPTAKNSLPIGNRFNRNDPFPVRQLAAREDLNEIIVAVGPSLWPSLLAAVAKDATVTGVGLALGAKGTAAPPLGVRTVRLALSAAMEFLAVRKDVSRETIPMPQKALAGSYLNLASGPVIEAEPPYVGCDEQSVFAGVVSDLCDALLSKKHLSKDTKISGSAGFNAGFFKAETKIEGSHKTVRTDNISTINQAANLIAECAATRSGNTVVIVDELDRIKSSEAKSQIAELIKRIHDMRIDIKLVMCGIGKTLDEIIGSHLSASRAITPFELAPISFDARWEIVNNAAAKLGFLVDRKYLIRISQISDGFPYYIHLIAENLFWEIFDHKESSLSATSADFPEAITRAISRAEAPLRVKYNYAIQKTKNSTDYEEALWAVAEGTHFERQLQDIYSKSYLKIMQHRAIKDRTRTPLNIERFRTRLYSLCKKVTAK